MDVRVLLIGTLIVAAALRPTGGGSATDNQQDGPRTRPRLIVMFVVDQMRADYLDVFANRPTGMSGQESALSRSRTWYGLMR